MLSRFGGIQFSNQPTLTRSRGRHDADLSLDLTDREKNKNKNKKTHDYQFEIMKVQLQFLSFFEFYRYGPNFMRKSPSRRKRNSWFEELTVKNSYNKSMQNLHFWSRNNVTSSLSVMSVTSMIRIERSTKQINFKQLCFKNSHASSLNKYKHIY